MNIKNWPKYFAAAALCFSLFSCESTFDFDPGNGLNKEQAYRNVYDADAAVIGIYGKFLGLAKQYVVLNELRADLMDVTENADNYLKQINTHTVTPDNPYASPLPFYELILNCNDALHNFQMMRQENRMTEEEYQHRYSDVGAVRCWLYLQLGIHWGEVPYVTEPIENVNDLKDASKFQRISFDQLLDKLVAFGESLPYIEQYPAGSTLQTTYDSYNMNKVYIFKKTILGDIHLWKGNWAKAAGYYNGVMTAADVLFPSKDNDQWYETYRIGYSSSLNGGEWATIFEEPFNERYSNYENIWVMPFDKNYSPKNPFIDMFSVSGSYLFKPSQKAIENWENEESNTNTRIGDAFRQAGSYRLNAGREEIVKYLGKYNASNPFENSGKWILYRAAILHLRMAEAANRDNRSSLAYGIVNNGIRGAFDDPTDLRAASSKRGRNVTFIQQSAEVGSPYYLDAREGNNPVLRGAFTRNVGIRARVSLNPIPLDSAKYFDINTPVVVTKNENDVILDIQYKPIIDQPGLTLFTEDMIVKEEAEECAFEGYRWGDLLRIALRRNDNTYLASKVAAKFPVGSAEYGQVMSRLSNKANWYLPFNW